MESEIDFLRSELDACKIRENTTKRLYESVMKTLENSSSQGLLVINIKDQSAFELKNLQESYNNELNSLRINHSETVKGLHENIHKLKEQIKDLEFEKKSEKLEYQQQILNLKTEIFSLKTENSVLLNNKKSADNEL